MKNRRVIVARAIPGILAYCYEGRWYPFPGNEPDEEIAEIIVATPDKEGLAPFDDEGIQRYHLMEPEIVADYEFPAIDCAPSTLN